MTPWHYRWLCQFSYINLPEDGIPRRGRTLGALSRELLSLNERGTLPCSPLSTANAEVLRLIASTPELSRLTLLDFVNQNSSSGFAAYALRAPDETLHCIFRGSEREKCGVPSSVDWVDNFLAPFRGSVQYADISAFVRRFQGEHITFSGHSKGAHNALYALAVSVGSDDAAVTFNGQGFSPDQLTDGQRRRLHEHAVHYVVCGDAIGALLYHPEKRIFVRRQGSNPAHALSSFSFDTSGIPIEAARPLWSIALEWTSRAWLRLHPPFTFPKVSTSP